MNKMAVIGFGCAGFNAVRAIRDCGSRDEIHVYSDANLPPANPMLTTYYASGRIGFEAMFTFGTLKDISEKYGITLHAGARVVAIDDTKKSVILEDNKRECFDEILIATGASVFVPPLHDPCRDRIFYMRTVDDAVRLEEALRGGNIHSAVVIGGSMVGIKVAELLHNKGIACTLADMAPHLFPLAAFPDVAGIIENRISGKGINLRLGYGMSDVAASGGGISTRFSDGAEIKSNILVICISTRANTGIAKGTSIHIEKGIVVNERMETSAKGIYAAGDCCEGRCLQGDDTQIIGLWANAAYQGETAGYNMAGKEAKFSGNILHNITHFMDMDFIGIGDNRSAGEERIYGDPSGKYIKAVIDGNRIKCINILDDSRISGIIKNYIMNSCGRQSVSVSPVMEGILLRQGLPAGAIDLFRGDSND